MKKWIIIPLLFIVFCSFDLQHGMVKVYHKDSRYSSDQICNLRDGKVYKKSSSYPSDIVCRIEGNKIYKTTRLTAPISSIPLRRTRFIEAIPPIPATRFTQLRMAKCTRGTLLTAAIFFTPSKTTKCTKATQPTAVICISATITTSPLKSLLLFYMW